MIINQNSTCVSKSGNGFAHGTSFVPAGYLYFVQADGLSEQAMHFVRVSRNLGFVPSLIIILYKRSNLVVSKCMYRSEGWTKDNSFKIDWSNVYYRLEQGAYVNENGFCLPFDVDVNTDVEWYAYE